ncbi:SDR family NAD(P)-dependent oxidoreductase [Streptomyces sp. NPDC058291]|uniref:SDR family NAD(P)-dependent oxidoreductase n=1 Tax=Streptomyces sp. NPDC058291 TaxID=3346427 RepID=UPI0036E516FB
MSAADRNTTLLGAEGARELIAFLTRADGAADAAVLERPVRSGGPVHRLTLRRPDRARAGSGDGRGPAAPARPRLLDRHVLRLVPAPAAPPRAGRAAPDLFPAGTAVLTNTGHRVRGTDQLPLDDTLEDAIARSRPRHIRVLVDLHGEQAAPSDALLDLHDAVFRTAKACVERAARPQSFAVVVLGGVDAARVPHPCAGLFTGFVKSLALEWPDTSVMAVVHEARDLVTAEPDAARETEDGQLLPVVYHAGGARLLWAAVADPGERVERRARTGDYTVVAAGGARGIGAELLLALARRDRPRLHLIGSTDPDADRAGPRLTRKDFIRARTTGPEGLTVREAAMAYDRLGSADEVRATLTALRDLCGADRVTYHRCDLRDEDEVRGTVRRITEAEESVDLLLNIAGTNRAASVEQKRLKDFRTVRDLKVRSYAHLKAAFGSRQPRLWCNFGSFVGFTGQTGETDYGAANDYFNTAALHHRARGIAELTLGWTLWRDVGLGATPLMRTFLAKSAQFTAMPTAEGVEHFLHELDQAHQGHGTHVTVFFGAAERAAIEAAVPGYLDFCRNASGSRTGSASPASPAPRLPSFYVDDIVERAPGRLTVVRRFGLDRDAYLREHVVDGRPTLPGTFVPELAAEAAMHLVPGRVPVVVEDVRLESFLRVYRADRDEVKKIRARLLADGPRESVVEVEVTGDVVAPDGRLLVKDRRHFSARVRLRDEPVAPPRWEHWDDHGAEPLADPYHVPNPAVLLSGVFVSTAGTRIHPGGRRAHYAPDRTGIDRWFSGLVVPSVLLDGLARVSVLDRAVLPGRGGDWTPLAVPRTIRRIDLYGGHTDSSLAAAGTRVELYSLPARLDLESGAANRAVAVTAAGDVVLQIKDMTGVVLGHVHQSTGVYRERPRDAGPAHHTTEQAQEATP